MEPIAAGRFAPVSRTFALRGTVAALMGIGLLTSVSVRAQEAGAQAPGDAYGANVVVVSGQRQALQSAQTIKKNAEQVIDTIVADDIGKFPDKNVAEILGRVTGVQILRNNGEASNIVIRGLGGVTTLFNGREMFTAANRSLNLTDVPVSMLQRVDVYKSQGADMVEGGTSGVIDVRTFRPFDFKGEQIAINARAENRDKAGKTDPQIGGLWSNRWKTSVGDVGLLGGLSYQRGRYHDEVAWAGQPANLTTQSGQAVQGADGNGRVMTTGDRKRVAALLDRNFDLFPILKEKAKQAGGSLSGGQQQQLTVARGLMADPKLLVVDEPTLGLAPAVILAMADMFKKLQGLGLTIVITEQNAEFALKVATRGVVIIIDDGSVKGSDRKLDAARQIPTALVPGRAGQSRFDMTVVKPGEAGGLPAF